MTESQYKVTVTGPGLSLDQQVSADLAKHVLAIVLGVDTDRPSRSKSDPKRQANGGDSPLDHGDEEMAFREFLDAHNAGRNIEKIACVAAYMKRTGSQSFDSNDVISQFESAGEPPPGNLARDITWARKAGWIAPKPGEDGRFYITNTGSKAVNDSFSEEVRAKSKASRGGRKKKRTRKPAK